jgi:serine/threonine protein kinase
VPDEWTDAKDLLRGLTRLDPLQRLTAREALQHPFIKLADKIQMVLYLVISFKLEARF